jgi:hypothetical protein
MARPARVRIRRRKPCVLARLRVLGWNVRFTTSLSRGGKRLAAEHAAHTKSRNVRTSPINRQRREDRSTCGSALERRSPPMLFSAALLLRRPVSLGPGFPVSGRSRLRCGSASPGSTPARAVAQVGSPHLWMRMWIEHDRERPTASVSRDETAERRAEQWPIRSMRTPRPSGGSVSAPLTKRRDRPTGPGSRRRGPSPSSGTRWCSPSRTSSSRTGSSSATPRTCSAPWPVWPGGRSRSGSPSVSWTTRSVTTTAWCPTGTRSRTSPAGPSSTS